MRRAIGWLAAALCAAALPAAAQTSEQFWPELDVYLPLSERTRLFLIAAGTSVESETGQPGSLEHTDWQAGVNLDITLTPIFRKKLARGDWQRERYLWMRVGYRYLSSKTGTGGSATENRGVVEFTSRTAPLAGGLEFVGRLRWDARDIEGNHSNRYRLRVQVEKEYQVRGHAVIPFVNAEDFYDTRYDAWNRQRYQLGVEIELDPQWRLEPSFYRQNDSRSQPDKVNALGLVLKYFH